MSENLRIDHVIRVVADLDEAADRFVGRYGLGSVEGGRHDGRGTGNRIIPLGAGYIELMAVLDAAEAERDPSGQLIARAAADGESWFGWCVSTEDIDATAARLGLTVSAWTRTRPDGVVLSWRLAGLEHSVVEPSLPFFIQWDVPPGRHPQAEPVSHGIDVRGIAHVELSGDSHSLDRWLGGRDIGMRITAGAPRVTAVAVQTDKGTVTLR